MPASGLPKFFSVDSTAPTPPTLQLCIDAMSAELGGTELASPNGGPPLLTASPWSAHEEASLRAKLLAADYPEQDDTPGPAGLKFRNMSSVDVVITQVFPVGAKVTGSVKAGKDWGFANVVLGAKWRIETYAGGIRVPEYELTAPGSHHVFIVDFRRPLAVTEFENCFGTAASSLRSGEKVILKSPPNWVSAKNFLSGVHTNLKNDPIIDAILAHDPDADAENVVQQLADYVDELLAIVTANEYTAKSPATINYATANTYVYKKPLPPDYAGLFNQGATCYMNSLLQSLFLTPELRYALYNWQYTPDRDPEREMCIPYQMQRLFCQMQLMDGQTAAETDSLTKSFGWAAGDQFQQQDATELLTMLTEALETCFKGTRGDGVIKALYEGVTKDYVQCRHCKYESGTKADFRTLNIAIRPFGGTPITSVEEGLANYFKPEDMTGDNQYECEPCGTKRDADKGIRLDKVPYIFTVSLLRFDYDWQQDARVKINDRVSFEETIDMAKYLTPSGGDEPEPAAAGGGAGEDDAEERGYRLKEGAGEILARGSSAVTDEEGMLYDLFAICVHAGGAHGGHYYAYCKPFGDTTSAGTDKEDGIWYEMNDSRVKPLSAKEWQQAYGGPTKSYNRGYAVQSSTSAYMLMYRRRDTKLNIDDVPKDLVPMYIFADQKAEEVRAEQERVQKEEDRKKKLEEKRLRDAQIPVAVWYDSRMCSLKPLKTQTWGDLKMMIFEEFELPEDESELRIVAHLGGGKCAKGDVEPIDEEDDTPLEDVVLLEQYAVLQVESRLGDGAWLTQAARETEVECAALGEPTEMMLCNADGSEKHVRWFWVDTKSHTLNWSKKRFGNGKRRLLAGCIATNAAESPAGLTFATSEGEICAIMADHAAAQVWQAMCEALLEDQTAMVSFTDVDGGEEFPHTIELTTGSTIMEARTAIAAMLDLDPDAFLMFDFEGKEKICGYSIQHLRGPGPDYGLDSILTAAKEISAEGKDLSCAALDEGIKANPSGRVDNCYQNTVRIWNLTKLPVQVERLTNMGRYLDPQYKKYVTLTAGYDAMVKPDKPLEERSLTWKTMQQNKSVEDKCDDPSFNVKGISWRLGVVGAGGLSNLDFLQEWTIGIQRKQNVLVEGFGEDEAPLTSSRLVFRIRKNARFGVKSEVLEPGHHKVPIYRFLGTADDSSELMFDMSVDENMLVRDFKMALAEKLRTETAGFPDADGTKLRVREMPSGNFSGEVFVDDVSLITPVTNFHGTERFAFTELDGPETKVSSRQVVITVMKFSPSAHTLGEFFEVVVNKTSTLDSLRDELAEGDPDIASAGDVSLGCTSKLIVGKYQKDLADTVWDMECLNWDWDRQTAWYQGKNNSLSLSKDGDIFYYKTAGEEAMEMTEGEMAAARKRATIESRKKKQAKTSKRDGPETGVVMRVARGDEASPTSAEQEATGKGDPPVVGLVANATTTSDVVQVAVPVVEADDHRAEEGEPEIGLERTISQAARFELRNEEKLTAQMRAKLDQFDEARAPTRSDRRDLEAWINESPTRQEFGKIRAQRDALLQLRGAQTTEEDDWVQISAPEELADLQTKDIIAEKEAVEREVEELRRELGLQ